MKKLYLSVAAICIIHIGFAQQIDSVSPLQDSLKMHRVHHLQEVIVTDQKHSYQANNLSSSLRLLTPLQKLPQNIQVITQDVLNDQQITTMGNDIIRDVSGAVRLEHWSMYTRINMRATRASEFRNGMNITSTWGPLSLDMGLVDRIEFVKGPAGFLMSNGEPGAIMNIVTKKPTGIDQGELSLMFGSYDLYRIAIDKNGRFDKNEKLLYRVNLIGQTQNSFRPYEFNKRLSFHPVITYKINDKTDFTAEYTLQSVNMSDVGSPYAYSPKNYADVPRSFTTLEPGLDPAHISEQNFFFYFHHHIHENWMLTVQSAYFDYRQQASDIWPSSIDSAGNMIRGVYNFDVLSQYAFGQIFLNGQLSTGHISHHILTGLDLGNKQNWYDWSQYHELDTQDHPFNIYQPVYGSPSNGLPTFDRSKSIRQRAGNNTINQSYSALYVQDELGFAEDKIRLTLAGRYTKAQQSDYGTPYQADHFTPRVGLSVSLSNDASVYALFDQSFLPQSGLLRGNKLPKPQTGNNLEFGIKKDFRNGLWNATVSVYRIQKNGLLVNDPDTTDNPNNRYSLQIGQSVAKGFELDIRGQILKNLQAVVNYAYTEASITKDVDKNKVGQPLPGYAHHIINSWLTYQSQNGKWKGFGVSAGCSYQKDRIGWSGIFQAAVPYRPLSDYFRLDGGVFWQINQLKINLTVNNILNAYLYSGGAYANFYYWQTEAPRNYKLGISYRF
ncbi:TonB-dependent siderophore receptor [Thermoflavifilum thermophilum]|uniref:Iron complex outermembrane recepter protein n=1 Tax=Thermoflavifilum thermophilum TaxID=1393122 RepID=A0A1I7N939_9BACT|nr:TonB-dependent siderophore receptor [Thermoflavifilum thermophilum]SFV31187.1 iron complex outermembrane recepter protein [Thermoflavifilum thermophilum]